MIFDCISCIIVHSSPWCVPVIKYYTAPLLQLRYYFW